MPGQASRRPGDDASWPLAATRQTTGKKAAFDTSPCAVCSKGGEQVKPIQRLDQIPPSSDPLDYCAWCWYVEHPFTDFPRNISSTICSGHQEWLLQQLHARRAKQNE